MGAQGRQESFQLETAEGTSQPGEVRSGWPRRGLAAARAFQAEARKQGTGGDSGRTAEQSSLPRALEDRSRGAPEMRLRWWAGPGSRAF